MAINNKKDKDTSVLNLADQEPQKEKKTPKGPGIGDSKDDGQGVDIIPTSDYKINQDGKKFKAHRIVFNKGEDDNKNVGVAEEMKMTYKQLAEVLAKNADAGKWIHDFVHSDNPKFEGKSKEMRKKMALAAYYAKQQQTEELKGGQVKLDKNHNGKLDADDFKKLRKEDMEDSAKDKKQDKAGMKRTAMTSKEWEKSAEDKKEDKMDESWEDMLAHSKEMSNNTNKTKTKTYHDVKKTSTGTVYTKQFDKDGTSKGTGGDAAAKAENAPKRGRGRPKKDKFAESVEMLMSLSEEQFDEMMEEGFDAFFEAFEQLDELSKTTLGSYAKKAAVDAKFKGFDAGFLQGDAMAHAKRMGDGADAGSVEDARAHSRLRGVKKAIDRLTK